MAKTARLPVITALLLTLSSCKTYYIPVDSFKQQFAGLDSSTWKEVTTRGPMGRTVTYKTAPIEFIKCIDKNGNAVELKNSPSVEIRFTNNDNKKTIFYFDRISVNDSLVTGVQSRIITVIRKTILLSTIKTIEVQDGKKNYTYVQ